ncbi:hypothetical protein E2C01_014596 [Portunus trituberculatus]|uniref:Uncharacterized protein n=1 Tax=Portunus trituberculatus TaxID=210409 RepID=A0A5B7DKH9_PORTR|nr:hypothetical protein [Portunus trituberculatus]
MAGRTRGSQCPAPSHASTVHTSLRMRSARQHILHLLQNSGGRVGGIRSSGQENQVQALLRSCFKEKRKKRYRVSGKCVPSDILMPPTIFRRGSDHSHLGMFLTRPGRASMTFCCYPHLVRNCFFQGLLAVDCNGGKGRTATLGGGDI